MKQVKLGLWKMPIPYLIQFCNMIVQMMTGNINFPSPNPKLPQVSEAIAALQTAYEAALQGGKTLKAAQRIKRMALLSLMSTLGAYVQEVSNGDEVIILSSGMSIKSARAPQPIPAQVGNLRFANNVEVGEASLLWDGLSKKNGYTVQTTLTPLAASSWVDAGLCTKRSITLTGLASGQVSWFRVAAFNAAGIGAWSYPAQKMIS